VTLLTNFNFLLGQDLQLSPFQSERVIEAIEVPFRFAIIDAEGDSIRYELPDLIEGFEVNAILRISNKTSNNWSSLKSVGSCGCAVFRSIDGKSVAAGESLDLNVLVLTKQSGVFRQKIDVYGQLLDGGETTKLFTVLFEANSSPPVRVLRRSLSLDQLRRGPVRLGLVPGRDDIQVDLDRVVAESEFVSLSVPKTTSSYEIELQAKVDGSELPKDSFLVNVRIPFRLRGNEQSFFFDSTLEFSESSSIRLLPRTVSIPSGKLKHNVLIAISNNGLDNLDERVFLLRMAEFRDQKLIAETSFADAKFNRQKGRLLVTDLAIDLSQFSEDCNYVLRLYEELVDGKLVLTREVPVVWGK
jgi:hypothetical protein